MELEIIGSYILGGLAIVVAVISYLYPRKPKDDIDKHYAQGLNYSRRVGVPINKKKAKTCFRKATEQGRADAPYELAIMLRFSKNEPNGPWRN